MSKTNKGIEYSLLESWDGWDEHGVCDLYFYDVKLREDVFGKDFVECYAQDKVDLGMYLESSIIEIYVEGKEEPVLTKKVKLSFVEEY